jgi:thiol-disulfide isomerase/thioredoxin
MKVFATRFFIFICFASLFSSCSEPGANLSQPADTAETGQKKANSDYPRLAEKIAQADMGTLDGSTTKIADHKGKVLLLNMWATWCGFCRQEMPVLVRLQDQHRDAGFEVIGMNVDDESLDEVNQFAQEMKLNYTLVWSDTRLTREFLKVSKFEGIPQSFLVDRDGNLRGIFTGANPANLRKMEELIAGVVAE